MGHGRGQKKKNEQPPNRLEEWLSGACVPGQEFGSCHNKLNGKPRMCPLRGHTCRCCETCRETCLMDS